MSYFDAYIDPTGCIEGYASFDLSKLGRYDWRFARRNMWAVERVLIDVPHRRIKSSRKRVERMRARYVAYREKYGKKPLFYSRAGRRGRELPKEYLVAASRLCRLGRRLRAGDRTRLGVIRLRTFGIAHLGVGDGTLLIGLGEFRGGFHDFGEIGDGAAEIVLAEVTQTALEVRICIFLLSLMTREKSLMAPSKLPLWCIRMPRSIRASANFGSIRIALV